MSTCLSSAGRGLGSAVLREALICSSLAFIPPVAAEGKEGEEQRSAHKQRRKTRGGHGKKGLVLYLLMLSVVCSVPVFKAAGG
ncbi:hypothetical protein QQF64_012742 [Cirrhinus molitorella]|uniref:Uncharacterized protein n=1 Tax=Cirrhinus molitorella TaxID=172907 RepID=A0ABR3LWC5_9TELE